MFMCVSASQVKRKHRMVCELYLTLVVLIVDNEMSANKNNSRDIQCENN